MIPIYNPFFFFFFFCNCIIWQLVVLSFDHSGTNILSSVKIISAKFGHHRLYRNKDIDQNAFCHRVNFESPQPPNEQPDPHKSGLCRPHWDHKSYQVSKQWLLWSKRKWSLKIQLRNPLAAIWLDNGQKWINCIVSSITNRTESRPFEDSLPYIISANVS